MCYTIITLGLLCFAYPTLSPLRASDSVRAYSEARKINIVLPDVSPRSTIFVQAEKAADPEKKEPGPEKKDSTSGDTRKQEEPSQQKDKKPQPKDFVPSEKIDADKAVDFPADI